MWQVNCIFIKLLFKSKTHVNTATPCVTWEGASESLGLDQKSQVGAKSVFTHLAFAWCVLTPRPASHPTLRCFKYATPVRP